ncbi:MAG: hypothetical protein M3514_16535 [Actinomycetota bacterium]|nr:hypothetical protein [Actinomycetota bacterium]
MHRRLGFGALTARNPLDSAATRKWAKGDANLRGRPGRDGGGVRCIIERQIAEGNWVATSYTLTQGGEDHVGLMLSRVAGGKIRESRVVARNVSESDERGTARKAFN